MADDLNNLQMRTNIGEIVTDAGYIGSTGSEVTEKHGIKHSVTALRGRKKNENKDNLNIRASVESTVRSVIHPFGGHLCKLPVRGKERIKTMTILSAAMVTIRRITEYLSPNNEENELIQAIC